MNKLQTVLLLCFLLFLGKVVAQSKPDFKSLVVVDKIIGRQNTALYNGTKYVEQFRTINERHKFFLSNNFLDGYVFYDNEFYGDLRLKFDLYADDLLMDIGYKSAFPILKLYKDRIQSFSLGDKTFLNIDSGPNSNVNGFYEVLWSSENLWLLKKHQKKKFRKIFQTVVYYEFEDDNSYYLKYDNDYYPLQTRGDLVRIFPNFKKEIKELYNKNLIKIDPDGNLVQVVRELNTLLENEEL